MDKWPQRDRFKALMKAYQEKEGLTQEQVAERLGIPAPAGFFCA